MLLLLPQKLPSQPICSIAGCRCWVLDGARWRCFWPVKQDRQLYLTDEADEL